MSLKILKGEGITIERQPGKTYVRWPRKGTKTWFLSGAWTVTLAHTPVPAPVSLTEGVTKIVTGGFMVTKMSDLKEMADTDPAKLKVIWERVGSIETAVKRAIQTDRAEGRKLVEGLPFSVAIPDGDGIPRMIQLEMTMKPVRMPDGMASALAQAMGIQLAEVFVCLPSEIAQYEIDTPDNPTDADKEKAARQLAEQSGENPDESTCECEDCRPKKWTEEG